MVTASSHGGAFGGAYTATLGSVSGGGAVAGEEKRAAPEVEKPLRSRAALECSIGDPVRLEMIGLSLVHWYQEPRTRNGRQQPPGPCQCGVKRGHPQAGLVNEFSAFHVRGTAPRASSSLRRAWGTRAL